MVMRTSMNSKMYLNNDKLGEIGARMVSFLLLFMIYILMVPLKLENLDCFFFQLRLSYLSYW